MGRFDPLDEWLKACARVELDDEARARFVDATACVQDWSAVVAWAEYHGLVPLVWRHVRACNVALPSREWKQIRTLVLRHRGLSRTQVDALLEIVDALDASRIEHLVLKGAVLAHTCYPSPDVRPMIDLDILVAPADAGRAQHVLSRLGFDAPLIPSRATQHFHHHLPAATRQRHGFLVSVDIHTDAVSRDQSVTLRMGSLSQPPRDVVVAGRRLHTFGHVDMLVHLCAHALEPGDRTRLITVADLVAYAARYVSEIDWAVVRGRHPRVVNALALMHYVTPLPESLRALRPPATVRPPLGVGRGLVPIGTTAGDGGGARVVLGRLLYPPEWWMHAYYGVPPGRSLATTRWGLHLWRIARWIGRRVLASSASLGRQRASPDLQPSWRQRSTD